MAIHFNPATEKRFEEALQTSGFAEESALLEYLLDVDAHLKRQQVEFRTQISRDLTESREQIARGEFVTEDQLQERLAERRAARRSASQQEQAA